MEKIGEIIEANDKFGLVLSYSPGYQSVLKDLKQSTRQRFILKVADIYRKITT